MNIIFMGTPDFAVPCLKKLIESEHSVAAVFTQPDKPFGRKQVLTSPPIKVLAQKYDIPVFQPEKLKGSNSAEIIKRFNPDIIVVVAYGKILPKEVLTSAAYGCINVHASLLPKYRGAAPIQWAVLNGDSETGVSIMQMDEGLDTGDVILTKKTNIDINETSEELFSRLSEIGADALIEALNLIINKSFTAVPQPKGDFGYAKMINKKLCPIDWTKSAFEIHNKVRALQTWPVALTKLYGKNLKIHKTLLSDDKGGKCGEVVCNNGRLVVSCGDGKCIEIKELQFEGKKRMTSKAFLLGNNIELHTILGE